MESHSCSPFLSQVYTSNFWSSRDQLGTPTVGIMAAHPNLSPLLIENASLVYNRKAMEGPPLYFSCSSFDIFSRFFWSPSSKCKSRSQGLKSNFEGLKFADKIDLL